MSEVVMLRYNSGKPPLSLIPTAWLTAVNGGDYFSYPSRLTVAVARVLDFGAKKYSANNWRKGGSWLSVLDCAFRHITWYQSGEENDKESGLSHLAHAACNIAFLLEFVDQESGQDDRFTLTKQWECEQDSSLSSAIESLLKWKDGGDHHNLEAAAYELAMIYEELAA